MSEGPTETAPPSVVSSDQPRQSTPSAPVKKPVKKAVEKPPQKGFKKAAKEPWATKPAAAKPAAAKPAAAKATPDEGPVKKVVGPDGSNASAKAASGQAKQASKRAGKGPGKGASNGRPGSPVPPRKLQPRWVVRLFAPPNIEGPRARMGIIWILFAVPAVYFGTVSTAALFGLHAGIAALQTGQAWRREGYKASRLLAAPAAVAMPVLAINSYSNPAIVMLALPVLAFIAALAVPRRRRRTSAAATAGATLRAAIPAGVAATGMVYIAHFESSTALVFLLLVSAYDVGHFVFGAETRSPLPGILMGAVTSLAFTVALFAITVFAIKIPPFEGTSASWVFGAMIAVFAPLGQIVASISLPAADAWVPALRRLDAYILTAPLWAWTLWRYLA